MDDKDNNIVSLYNSRRSRTMTDSEKKFQKLSDSIIDLTVEVEEIRNLLNRVLRLLKGKK